MLPQEVRKSNRQRMNPEEMKTYEKSILEYNDVRDAMACSRDEGRLEGIMETAVKLIKDNMPVELIKKYTGLTEKDIESLRLSNN